LSLNKAPPPPFQPFHTKAGVVEKVRNELIGITAAKKEKKKGGAIVGNEHYDAVYSRLTKLRVPRSLGFTPTDLVIPGKKVFNVRARSSPIVRSPIDIVRKYRLGG
jgi:hypothetical protein